MAYVPPPLAWAILAVLYLVGSGVGSIAQDTFNSARNVIQGKGL